MRVPRIAVEHSRAPHGKGLSYIICWTSRDAAPALSRTHQPRSSEQFPLLARGRGEAPIPAGRPAFERRPGSTPGARGGSRLGLRRRGCGGRTLGCRGRCRARRVLPRNRRRAGLRRRRARTAAPQTQLARHAVASSLPDELARELRLRSALGGVLAEDDDPQAPPEEWKVVSVRRPTAQEWHDLAFAWDVVRHVEATAS